MTCKDFFLMQHKWKDHPLFVKDEFNRSLAWLWLLDYAVYQDTKIDVKGKMIHLKRGQLCYSLRYLSKAWGWNKDKVDRFLTRLKTETMIETATETGQLVITICNYCKYQGGEKKTETATETATETGPRQDRDRTETNKKQINNNIYIYKELFEKFWQAYDKHVGKDASYDNFIAIIRNSSELDPVIHARKIIKAATWFSQYCKKINHPKEKPETWLKRRGWNDMPTEKITFTNKQKQNDLTPEDFHRTPEFYNSWIADLEIEKDQDKVATITCPTEVRKIALERGELGCSVNEEDFKKILKVRRINWKVKTTKKNAA